MKHEFVVLKEPDRPDQPIPDVGTGQRQPDRCSKFQLDYTHQPAQEVPGEPAGVIVATTPMIMRAIIALCLQLVKRSAHGLARRKFVECKKAVPQGANGR